MGRRTTAQTRGGRRAERARTHASRVRRPRATVALGAVAVVVLLTACTPVQEARLQDDAESSPFISSFYEQPEPLPAGSPGDLIRTSPAVGAPPGGVAYRILFHSTDLDGRPVVDSGLLVAPGSPAPAGGRTIVSWGHPTTGAAEKCAPSRSDDPYDSVEGLTDFLNRGYAVVYTDYTGMGTAGPDSYLVGGTEGRNVLDAARAARTVLGRDGSQRVVLWGHSQGGQAVLFAAQLAHGYAPELDVQAAAAAAPATDLASLLRADIGDVSGVTIGSYAFQAYASVYDEPLASILTPHAITALPAMNDLCLLSQNKELHTIAQPLVGRFLTDDPETTEPWSGLLAQNTPGATALTMPLFVAQGEDDRLVRPTSTDAFVRTERDAGTTVTYDRIPGATHATVALRSLRSLFDWLHSVGVSGTSSSATAAAATE
ncbi:alpha/beta fold hydrolase [Leifsonia sp. ZF2019]|uniref:alpha/beta fold hydrolase n=1 Tax=Leifsonia sp. ZF2019 TaxID=2781978 RepID=UPI001CBC434C|nr:alpha/beta fold hydrolase [Leifsonia sp. ZF2019]